MKRTLIAVAVLLGAASASWPISAQKPAQTPPATPTMLTVDSIMRGPKLVGTSPSAIQFSRDSSKIYFSWQKAGDERSARYVVNRDGSGLRQMTPEEIRAIETPRTGRFDKTRRRLLLVENGDVVIYDVATNQRLQFVTRTSAAEGNARWARNDSAVTFTRDGNLYLMSLTAQDTPTTTLTQLTDIVTPPDPAAAAGTRAGGAGAAGTGATGATGGRGGAGGRGDAATETEAQRLLREQERNLIEFIKNQQSGRGGGAAATGRGAGPGGAGAAGPPPAPPIARLTLTARQSVADLVLSGDEKYVFVGVTERPEGAARGQDTPNYVTSSAYPEMIPGRPNVGDVQSRRLLAILDVQKNTTTWADATAFAGVERKANPDAADVPRLLNWTAPDLSDDGAYAVAAVRSLDNKDRWFVTIDPATGKARIIDWLHDDAWIREQGIGGGFGGGAGITWLPDNKRFLFLSEKNGYMHVHAVDMSAATPVATSLTTGKWEVTDARLSNDRRTLFLTTNEVHPGERHFYTMRVDGGPMTKITTAVGSNEATVSPDEKSLAILHSYSTKPPELQVMNLALGSAVTPVTVTTSEEWRSFKWIDPKVITYKARDGAEVYARLYTPEMIGAKRDPKKPAVVFVHGAGYLQNAHKYWSTYYREYMFHNLLAQRGYVVLDPDYRASSGYGRDWRTAIYRHMGGKDLEDVVDGAKFLVDTEKIDPRRIGVYGGSYGGFITLMAMFTTPDVFAAGAALRPVTDWSHYNHGYTSNILNVPQNDPEAYRKSSPIFFAEGLKGRLLICHGMVDTNVFFQDSVRLIQRLIELRKENWEVAPYPVENHGFTEETSWADEYKRILKLFEETLRK
jgi:dipeptidyl aminopeptidase/acylaminoacyl peptidase